MFLFSLTVETNQTSDSSSTQVTSSTGDIMWSCAPVCTSPTEEETIIDEFCNIHFPEDVVTFLNTPSTLAEVANCLSNDYVDRALWMATLRDTMPLPAPPPSPMAVDEDYFGDVDDDMSWHSLAVNIDITDNESDRL
jgi:hypothetical protein